MKIHPNIINRFASEYIINYAQFDEKICDKQNLISNIIMNTI